LKDSYKAYLITAETNKEVIKKTFTQWKKKKPKQLDDQFNNRHNAVFKTIDCLSCANCCKTTSPIFREIDIKRIAKNMRMKEVQFIDKYLQLDQENDYVLKSSPCAFLGTDNKCSIYDFRPLACKEYPHTDRKNMHQILDITLMNSLICPAVAKVVEEIVK
jgi:Fe-S-cluster containining protein